MYVKSAQLLSSSTDRHRSRRVTSSRPQPSEISSPFYIYFEHQSKYNSYGKWILLNCLPRGITEVELWHEKRVKTLCPETWERQSPRLFLVQEMETSSTPPVPSFRETRRRCLEKGWPQCRGQTLCSRGSLHPRWRYVQSVPGSLLK